MTAGCALSDWTESLKYENLDDYAQQTHSLQTAGYSEQTARPAHRYMYVWKVCNYPAFTAATLRNGVVVARAGVQIIILMWLLLHKPLLFEEQAQRQEIFSCRLNMQLLRIRLTIWMKRMCCLRVCLYVTGKVLICSFAPDRTEHLYTDFVYSAAPIQNFTI